MYGKIFESMYEGTIAEDWRALVTFQQMIVLCDSEGTVDMTPGHISRRTGIPIEHIKAGIEVLENTDPYSRTPDEDGRRIVRLDDHRPWGWYIVNHNKYKTLKDQGEVRRKNRERKAAQRAAQANAKSIVPPCPTMSHDVTQCHTESSHTNANTNANTNAVKKTDTEKKTRKRSVFTPPDWIPKDLWADYLETRKEKKHPMNTAALALCVAAIEKCVDAGVDVNVALTRMVETGWRSCKVEWFMDSPSKFSAGYQSTKPEAQPSQPAETEDERARRMYFDKFGEWPEDETLEPENNLRVISQ